MAKSFKTLKDPKLHLLDMITIGKYKGCRVDSIVEQDHEYLIYMDKEKILSFSPEVLDKLKNKFSINNIEVHIPNDMKYGNRYYLDDFDYDDIPF